MSFNVSHECSVEESHHDGAKAKAPLSLPTPLSPSLPLHAKALSAVPLLHSPHHPLAHQAFPAAMSSSSEPLHFSQEDMAAYKVQMTELEREQFEKLWPRMQQRVLLRMLRLDDPATPYRRSRPLPRPLPPLPPRYRPNNTVGLVYLWISAIFSFFVFAIVTLRRPPSPFRPSRPPTSQYADRISEGVYGDEGMARRPGGAPPDSSRSEFVFWRGFSPSTTAKVLCLPAREVLRSGILEYPRPRRQSSSSSRNGQSFLSMIQSESC